MKVKTTPEKYAARMQRHAPAPKKGKKRKDGETVAKESNTALVEKNAMLERAIHRAANDNIGLAHVIKVLEWALKKACGTMAASTPEELIKKAEAAIEEDGGNG